jgi:pSer/pThr/pTyr-binding forkhead associated (FHA) protein
MSEGVLTVLKFCLLALLYLFLARVVWTVSTELRGTPAVAAAPPPTPRSSSRGSRKGGWRVTIVEPPSERGSAFDLNGELTIGRAGGCGITLSADTFVSQVHARVFDRDGDAYVEDLGSTNGTSVNGNPIEEPTRLKRGDQVHIGETVLEVTR